MKTHTQPILTPVFFFLLTAAAFPTAAQRNAGGGAPRSSARGSVNQPSRNTSADRGQNASSNRSADTNSNRNTNTNVNRNANVNVNQNVNVNRDVNVNTHGNYYGGGYGGPCCYRSGVGTAAAVTAAAVGTAIVVGSMVNSLPPSCTAVAANGVTYQKCGSTYYQPQFAGGNTTYVVVNAP